VHLSDAESEHELVVAEARLQHGVQVAAVHRPGRCSPHRFVVHICHLAALGVEDSEGPVWHCNCLDSMGKPDLMQRSLRVEVQSDPSCTRSNGTEPFND
jgi:hypothetical protein